MTDEELFAAIRGGRISERDAVDELIDRLRTAGRDLRRAQLAEQDARAEVTRLRSEETEFYDYLREWLDRDQTASAYQEEVVRTLGEEADLLGALAKAEAKIASLSSDVQSRGRPRAVSDAQALSICRLRKKGLSLRAIADEVGCSVTSVRTVTAEAEGRRKETARELARVRSKRYRDANKLAKASLREHRKATSTYKRSVDHARAVLGGGVAPRPGSPKISLHFPYI